MAEITEILEAINRGDPMAAKDLLPLVYDQLRAMAAQRLASEAAGQTLQPTALVHEVYSQMVGAPVQVAPEAESPKVQFANRAHFFAAAAESMRRILIEVARRKRHRKRFSLQNLAVGEAASPDPAPQELDLIALDEALKELSAHDPRKAKLVEMRFFAGSSDAEVAEFLGVSVATVERDWAFSKAWLFQRLREDSVAGES